MKTTNLSCKRRLARAILSWVLAFAVVLSMAPLPLITVYAGDTAELLSSSGSSTQENTTEFLGGTGTADNPYLIANKTHLNNVRNYLNAHFKLVTDIEFSSKDFEESGDFYNDGAGWKPIGQSDSKFTGTFDGGGHTIKGLYVNLTADSSTVYAGLFGYSTGTIKNTGLLDSSITTTANGSKTYAYTGSIVGYNDGTIQNCYNTGSISAMADGNYAYAGGIVGDNYDGTISNCYNTGSISATAMADNDAYAYAGGIAGYNLCTVDNCYNTGTVSADSSHAYIGSIVGYNSSNSTISTISNCYNTGSISSDYYDSYAGGIAGYNNIYGTIEGCYNTGTVSADSSHAYIGGIAGKNDGTITNAYYLNTINCGVGSGTDAGIQCTEEQLRQQATFTGFDFDTVWQIDSMHGYPYPQLISNWQQPVQRVQIVTPPTILQTVQGVPLDLTGATVTITYSDGVQVTTTPTQQMVYGLNINILGSQNVYFAYGGKVSDTSFAVNVVEKSAQSIAVTTPPSKTTYVLGQPLNLAGGELTLYYNNTSTQVPLSQAKLTYAADQTSTVPVTVEYQGFVAEFTITVAPKQADTLVLFEPEKVVYTEGEALDLTGAKLRVTYVSEDNYTEEIPLTADMITGYNPNQPGIQQLTVTYGGKTTTFIVRVIAKVLQSIQVTTLPTKTQYLEDKDTLDLTGGKLTASYDNGTTQVVDLTEEMVTGFDNTKVGKQTLTVTYNGKTTTFEVEIIAKSLQSIAVTTLPTKTQYLEGKDTLDLTGGKLTASYDNGTTQVVDLTDNMVTGFDNTKAGEQTITVIYQTLSTTFTVEVNHDWEADFTTDQAPTCTTAGSKSRHCAYCGAKTDETAIPALGHSFTNYISNNNATCTENSTETAKCDRCGETDTREIANTALGHSYSADWTIDQAPTCTTAGSQSHHCTRCDAMADITPIPATGHSFGTWKVEKPATATEDGLAYRECSVCHEREEKILAAGEYIAGDVDSDGKVTDKDVEYLLYYVVYPTEYPISQDCDFNKDGSVNDKDVEYLLYHIVFPDEYPLEINKNQQ